MTNTPMENIDKDHNTGSQVERTKQTFETKTSRLQSQELEEAKTIQEDLATLEQRINDTKNTSTQTPETANISTQKIDTTTRTAIDQLGRPQAAEGLKTSYATIQQDIAKSDQDKNPIARGLGKAIKRILGQ